jgi:polysaccharide export outer membrane protein
MLQQRLAVYIKDPIINLRIMSLKFRCREVNEPGTYSVDSERITLIEALLEQAKDFIYGKKK